MSDAEATDDVAEADEPTTTAADAVPPNATAVLEYLVQAGRRRPRRRLRVHHATAAAAAQLDVRVGDGDMGRVIGKRGRIAQSIRTVVRAAAVKDDAEVDIEFVD